MASACKRRKTEKKEVKKGEKDKAATVKGEGVGRSKGESFEFFYSPECVFSQFHPCKFTVDDIEYNCMEQYMHHQKAVVFEDEAHAKEIMNTAEPRKHKSLGRKVENFDKDVWNVKSLEVVKKGSLEKHCKGIVFVLSVDLPLHTFDPAGTQRCFNVETMLCACGINILGDSSKQDESKVDTVKPVLSDHNMSKHSKHYRQNPDMKRVLFNTYPRTLVEASPRDRIWGIGMGKNNPDARDRSKWRGKNKLGQTLTEVRETLRAEEKKSASS